MEPFIYNLIEQLKNPLPGKLAHQKLYPESRKMSQIRADKNEAGVLILIYPDNSGKLTIPLMKRPENSGPHSGQVSLPGGKYEEFDQNFETTALRESEEEIGVLSSEIKILGKLTDLYIPVSNFLVHPYIGYVQNMPKFSIDIIEVEYLLSVSLEELLRLPIKSRIMDFDDKSYRIPYYDIHNEIVWGATSMILCEFIEVAKACSY